jgi:retron-type reverse transcriptase
MSSYDSFFTDEAIIEILCKLRMDFCRKAHEKEFFEKIAPSKQGNNFPEILKFFPPRSKWKRAHKDMRKRHNPHFQNYKDLRLTVVQRRKQNATEDQVWVKKQDQLIDSIRLKALSSNISLASPRIKPIPKDKSKSAYRILADYNGNLVDSIIIRQCAKYLRRRFDNYFLSCSYAFRLPATGKPFTHHDAFDKLAVFWKQNLKDKQHQAWIAECDIQGFFDIIDHKVVLSCYDEAVSELEQSRNIFIDKRARCVIAAYLDSYTYNNYGRQKTIDILKAEGCPKPVEEKVKNRDFTLKECLYPEIQYGVPQGGALSVFFANLILHKADLAVVKILEPHGNAAVYVRYCDDMVIASLDKEATTHAFGAYIEELSKLKLKHHEPKPINAYLGVKKRAFWEVKTKETYLWGDNNHDRTAVPWLAFVGYRLRHDGMVKIRPTSLEKELQKQREIRIEFEKRINKALEEDGTLGFSERELLASLEGRLRAGAIGKRSDLDLSPGMEVCEFGWCIGFKNLASEHVLQGIAQSQLRRLDRGLNKQITFAKKALAKHSKRLHSEKNGEKKFRLKFFGKPRSYAGQLQPYKPKVDP